MEVLGVKKWIKEDNLLILKLNKGTIKISFAERDILRFRYTDKEHFNNVENYILQGDIPEKGFTLKESGNYLELATESLRINICLGPFGIEAINNRGDLIAASAEDFIKLDGNNKTIRLRLREDEGIYGLGQDPMANLNQRDKERRMWQQWGSNGRSGNGGVPFMLSSKGYGVLLNSSYPSRFAIGKAEVAEFSRMGDIMAPAPWSWDKESSETDCDITAIILDDGELDLFIMCRDSFDAIIERYNRLTGSAPMLPKWAYGFIQCKNRYRSQEELMAVARKIREQKIPCDVLVIDWLWFREFGDLDWDRRYWPNVEGMFKELNSMGFKVMQAQHPFLSKDGLRFEEFETKGYINKVPEGKRYTFDHSNPEARNAWWETFKVLHEQGIRGYWTDMGELEEHFQGTVSHMGDREKVHNIYSMLWAKGLYEGQKKDFGTRVFTLARTAYAGMQKYGAALWSGDIDASWETLKRQVVVGQEVCLSGIPYWTTDIGGFLNHMEFTPELYIRWLQFGVFCSLFRTHGTRPGNELWSFGKQAEKICRDFVELRYKLLPYIYSCAKAVADSGKPMMRAMILDYPKDKRAVESTLQFMFGPSILAAPVVEKGARKKEVYLPEGSWYDFWTGKNYKGKSTIIASAPLEKIPLFIKAGAVIPMGEAVQFIDPADQEDVSVHIYPGQNGDFKLYEDDGITYSYESGNYVETMLEYREDKNKTIYVYPLKTNEGILKERSYTFVVHEVSKPKQVIIDEEINNSWVYYEREKELVIRLDKLKLSDCVSIVIIEAEAIKATANCVKGLKAYADTDLENNGELTVNLCIDGAENCPDLSVRAKLIVPDGWSIWKSDRSDHDINCYWKLSINNEDTQSSKVYSGATLTWRAYPVAEALPAVSEGKIVVECMLKGATVNTITIPIEWGSGFITRYSILGSLENWDNCSINKVEGPEVNPNKPYYIINDGKYSWMRDRANEYNCFGYIDFRRLGAYNQGEAINGTAYAKCSLWSPDDRKAYMEVSAETGIKLILNEEEIFKANEIIIERKIPAPINLKQGWNSLLIKSAVYCEKPYGGREYGFNLRIVDESNKAMREILVKPSFQ